MQARLEPGLAVVPRQEVWHFGGLELDLEQARLTRDGQVLPFTPLMLSLLSYLVRHHERIVTHDELASAVWQGVAVGAGSLRQAIWELRQKLAESAAGPAIIQTIRGRGYQFVAKVGVVRGAQRDPAPGAESRPGLADETQGSGLPGQGLFGRDHELSRLRSLLDGARKDAGRACAIVGPAGVGKSRLARELSQSLARAPLSFVEGHADANRMAPPFWPWRQVLTGYLQANPDLRSRCSELAPAAFRLLMAGAPLAAALVSEAPVQQQRFSLLAEMGRLFVTLAHDAPGLILFEDLQWADEASIDLLTHLLPLLARTRSLLVVTCRAVRPRDHRGVARALRELARTAWSEQIELRNLTAPAVAQLLAARSGNELPPAWCDEVYEISRGNPLFAQELSWALAKRDASSETRETPDLSELQSVIKRRLEALPDEALFAARAASVLSPDFSLAELAGMLREPPADVLVHIDVCFEQEVFAEGAGGRFSFAHPVLREAAYALLAREERCQLHRLAGEWLESQGGDLHVRRSSELARHFVAAAPHGCARKAIRYASECAASAYASTAYADCVFQYEQALACAELDPAIGPESSLELALLRGEGQRAAGVDTERVNGHFLQLAQRAEALESPTLFARAVLGYVGQRSARFTPTRFPAACHSDQVVLLERALGWLDPEPSELRALLLCSLTGALLHTTERARREGALAEALQIAALLDAPWLKARVLATRVYCCAAPDAHDERLPNCNALVAVAREHALVVQEADALMTRAVLQLGRGSPAEAEQDASRARLLADKLDLPQVRSRCALVELMRAFWQGNLAGAKLLTEQALAANPEDAIERAFFMVRMATLDILTHGLRPEAVRMQEGLLAEHPNIVGIHAALASVHAALGHVQTAERHFDSAAQDNFRRLPEDLIWIGEMTLLAEAAKRLDDRERASAVYERLLPYGHLFDFFAGEALPGGPVAYWLAELAVTLGHYDKAEAWLAVADGLNARLGATLFEQIANLCRTRLILLSRPGQAHEAQRLMQEVLDFSARTGILQLQIAVQELQQEAASQPT